MWLRIWHSGIPSLAIATACGLGLLVSPESATDPLRAALRDALVPGCRVVDAADEAGRAAWNGCANATRNWLLEATDPAGTADANRTPPADVTHRLRALEVELAAARQQIATLERDQALRITPGRDGQSLLSAGFVPARVIAADRHTRDGLAARLIDGGTAAGLAADDLVIEPLAGDAPQAARESLVLDRGTHDDLATDAPVIRGGTLIGRVVAPGLLTSTVQLVSDPEFRTGARIVRITPGGPVFGAAGVFAGTGRGSGRLELIPVTAPVSAGDRIYAVGPSVLDEHWFYIGEVVHAEVIDGEPHWQITVRTDATEPPRDVAVLTTTLNTTRLTQLAAENEAAKN